MLYSVSAIADAAAEGLHAEARRLDLEQAVRGIDALDELRLHPILAAALRAAGFGVFCEQRYPAGQAHRRETEGDRCDLVLTEGATALSVPSRPKTLFDPPGAVPLEEAFWLEVKVVGQFAPEGPNPRYSAQLLRELGADIRKLHGDRAIAHAALLLVLFARDRETAEHDLAAWLERCLDRGLPVGAPSLRTFAITDRIGNAWCAVGVYPVLSG